MKYNRSL
jgi:hypothetical protein